MSEIYKNTNSVINVGAVTYKDWNKNQNIFYIKISIKTRCECQKLRLNLEKKLNLKDGRFCSILKENKRAMGQDRK